MSVCVKYFVQQKPITCVICLRLPLKLNMPQTANTLDRINCRKVLGDNKKAFVGDK